MRTVDPELWSHKLKRQDIEVTRRLRFGQRAACGLEARLRGSLLDAVHEFRDNCSLGAVQYYNIDHMSKYERYRHMTLLAFTLVLGIAVTAHNYAKMHERPPLTVTRQATGSSIASTRFPAVALCSNNVISKAALNNYTRYLYTHPMNKIYRYSESRIEHDLLSLGSLLTLTMPRIQVKFEKFLREAVPDFNITDIMFMLSTKCSVILQRCSWRGRVQNCDALFAARLTALGFCCVFNSRYQPVDAGREPVKLDLTGQDYGLGVVIKEERDDFAYVRRPAYGMEVGLQVVTSIGFYHIASQGKLMLLFEGDEYPLLESGDVRLYPIPRNASLYLKIRQYKQEADDDIRYYSEEWRGCRLHGGGLSWCLTECRRDTAAALCGCVPYALRPQTGAPGTAAAAPTAPACTLSELGCLNKHREKFMYLYPGDDAHPSLSEEMQDALDCSHCVVLCKRQLYAADISYAYYTSKPLIYRNFLSQNLSLINGTILRLFYKVEDQGWYKVEALMRWYEMMVNLSTHWMLVTGVSMLCYSEFLYHFTFRWVYHFVRRTRIANMLPLATSN